MHGQLGGDVFFSGSRLPDDPPLNIDLQKIPGFDRIVNLLTNQHRQADINRIPEENPGKGLGHHRADPESL